MIKPIGSRILIEPLEAETMTASGLVIPDSARQTPQEALVVAVGSGRLGANGEVIPFDVKVGDKVIYSLYGGTKVSYGSKSYIVVEAVDLIAVVE